MQAPRLPHPSGPFFVGACVLVLASTASADEKSVGIHIQDKASSEKECEAEAEEIPQHCKHGRFILKAGFDPDEKWVAGASVEKNGLFGSDHRLSLSAELSERRQEFRTEYDIPTLFGSEFDFHAENYTRRLSYRRFEQENTGIAMRFGRALSPNLRAYVGYRLELAETKQLAANGPGNKAIRDPINESGIIAALEVGLRFDNRDASRMGSTASLFVSQSDRRLGSDYELTRLSAIVTRRAPLIGPLTLNLRGYGESIVSRDGNKIPLAERLQWNGHSDVRGYGLYSTGPELGADFKAGGQAEILFPLISRWNLSGALFYDAGLIASRDPLGSEQFSLRQSAGAGLRWDSPIGPLGVDFAMPLGDPEASPSVLFTIGDSF